MAQDLELVGGVKTLNPQPSDPRSRRNTIAEVQGDATYYKGYPDIYIVDKDKHYRITGGSVGAWILEEIVAPTKEADVADLEVYDSTQTYDPGIYRSYVDLESLNEQFRSNAIYLSMTAAGINQTPETHPYDPTTGLGIWWYLGEKVKTGDITTSRGFVRSLTELYELKGYREADTVGYIDLWSNRIILYIFSSTSFSGIKPNDILVTDSGRWTFGRSIALLGSNTLYEILVSQSNPYWIAHPGGTTYFRFEAGRTTSFACVLDAQVSTLSSGEQTRYSLILDNSLNSNDLEILISSSSGNIVWGPCGAITTIKAGEKFEIKSIGFKISTIFDFYTTHDNIVRGGSSGHTIKDSTQSFPQRTGLKFIGNAVVTDSEEDDETVVEIKGGDEVITGELSWSGSLWQISMLEDKVFRRLINTGTNSLTFETIDIQTTSKEITARINNSNNTSTISTITFPSSWRWASGAMPSGLAAGVVAVLWIKNITSTEVLADWII